METPLFLISWISNYNFNKTFALVTSLSWALFFIMTGVFSRVNITFAISFSDTCTWAAVRPILAAQSLPLMFFPSKTVQLPTYNLVKRRTPVIYPSSFFGNNTCKCSKICLDDCKPSPSFLHELLTRFLTPSRLPAPSKSIMLVYNSIGTHQLVTCFWFYISG